MSLPLRPIDYGLRDYGTAKWEGGDANCEHNPQKPDGGERSDRSLPLGRGGMYKDICTCGAKRIDAQLGLEPTLQEYIDNTVKWCAEVWRVLRDDGTFFLNLGDSYFGSNKGFMADGSQVGGKKQATNKGSVTIGKNVNAQYANAYGISGKEPASYQGRGCLCGNLCDVCREVYHRKSHTYASLDPMLVASLSLTTQERKEFENDHFPTSDFSRLEKHIFPAILGLLNSQDHAGGLPPSLLESMPDEFSRLLLDECWQRGDSSLCLLCARSLSGDVRLFDHNVPAGHSENPEGNQDKTSGGVLLENHNQNKDKACEYCDGAYPYYTKTSRLKPKDLMLVPHRVAIALQEWGWWVRSAIVWHKLNPMPESVTDRPTKAHEYIFLLTKNKNYYYDADSIREKGSPETAKRLLRGVGDNHKNVNGAPGQTPHSMNAPRPHASRRTNSAPFSGSALGPEINTTLSTNDGTFAARGGLDFSQSEVSINGSVTRDAQRFQVVNPIGLKIAVETPEGHYMVDLKKASMFPASLASMPISIESYPSLCLPVFSSITDSPSTPCWAILASPVDTEPFSGTLLGAEIVGLECAFVAGEYFAASITLDINKSSSTLLVWTSLFSSHVSFIPGGDNNIIPQPAGRNKRTVWTIATKPYSGAHFATFPPEIPEICIKAGTSEKGVCPVCGNPWVRIVEASGGTIGESWHNHEDDLARGHRGGDDGNKAAEGYKTYKRETTGWQPTCSHDEEPIPATVLDPFGGSGTTAMVANQLGRHGISLDLSWEYLQLAKERTGAKAIAEWESGKGEVESNLEGLPIFELLKGDQ